MDTNELVAKIEQLPIAARQQALDFVDFLYDKYNPEVDENLIESSEPADNGDFIANPKNPFVNLDWEYEEQVEVDTLVR